MVDYVKYIYTENCIKDSFAFANYMQNCSFNYDDKFVCSFDISNLFTCVLLQETTDICADALYCNNLSPPQTVYND